MLKVSENPVPRMPVRRALEDDLGAWWVLRVKPRQEKSLAWDLARCQVGYYLPLITKRTTRRDNGKSRKSVVCLFPGYISVVDYPRHKLNILRTGRVTGSLEVHDQEQFVSELARIEKAVASGEGLEISPLLAEGRRVVIARGLLEGVRGVVTHLGRGSSKVFLNVEMFGSSVAMTIPAEDLMLQEEEEPPRARVGKA